MAIQPSDSGESSRRTREILRESEERFRLLVEGVKDYAIFMLDVEGRVSTWNSGARRIKGYESSGIIGEHFSVFYTREDVARGHREEVLCLAAADGQYEEEGLRVRKDGSTFWANVVITALRDGAGNLRPGQPQRWSAHPERQPRPFRPRESPRHGRRRDPGQTRPRRRGGRLREEIRN